MPDRSLKTVGLFAGIGGIELGFERAGHSTALLCEVDPFASAVLAARFEDVTNHPDVTTLDALPDCDVLSAGFPCQDLSQAGRTAGISGSQSGLVGHVFRLLDGAERPPTWLVLENVPFMLQLERGEAMRYLVEELGRRGWRWAYRVVDAQAFGLPQRRRRVIFLASQTEDPRTVLFEGSKPRLEVPYTEASACGFYWTEGLRGLGWAVEAVPTLKGGSGLGIASPPAIWDMETDSIFTPDIRDAERLQGFPAYWTEPALDIERARGNPRWKLVGNAVSVRVAAWLGDRLAKYTGDTWIGDHEHLAAGSRWPDAAWGEGAGEGAVVCSVEVTQWPVAAQPERLSEFLKYDRHELSFRASRGFLRRTQRAKLRFENDFLEAVAAHVERTAPSVVRA